MTTSKLTAWAVMLCGASVLAAPGDPPPYCTVATPGASIEVVRPGPGDPALDDVNWFARPIPNPQGHRIVAVASHNLNYLYDLTTGRRVRMPDKSDAVATPDGRYITVPSHYTAANSVNFYDAATLLARLDAGRDASDVPAVFEHRHRDVHDVYYQSVGIVSQAGTASDGTTVYRMMFSGSTMPAPPGFRVVDYTFTRVRGALTVTPIDVTPGAASSAPRNLLMLGQQLLFSAHSVAGGRELYVLPAPDRIFNHGLNDGCGGLP